MATQIEPKELETQEQIASIRRHLAEIDQRMSETRRSDQEIFWKPWQILATLVGAGAAFFAAGAAVVRILFT